MEQIQHILQLILKYLIILKANRLLYLKEICIIILKKKLKLKSMIYIYPYLTINLGLKQQLLFHIIDEKKDHRKFKDNNDKRSQLTLIEIENVNFYNKNSNSKILPINFRRNIITEGVKLNDLLNKEFFVGNVKLKGHALCHPCKYLENLLMKKNFVKEMMFKAGLRCEILTSGKISVGDIIKSND